MLNMQGDLNAAKKTIDVNKELKKQNTLKRTEENILQFSIQSQEQE